MNHLDKLNVQLRSIWPTLLLILATSAILIGAVLFIHLWEGVRIGNLTRDPVAVLGGAAYTGFLSQAGIFFWAASATVCFFAASVIGNESSIPIKRFFFASGLLSLYLGLDDVFQLHEEFFPYIGVPEEIILYSYFGIALLWLIKFRSIILITEYLLLGAAIFFFSASIAVDVVCIFIAGHLFEDGTKTIGIICWLAYFYRTAAAFLVQQNTAQQDAALDGNSASCHFHR